MKDWLKCDQDFLITETDWFYKKSCYVLFVVDFRFRMMDSFIKSGLWY